MCSLGDLLLFEISYDYVFPPGYCLRRGWKWSLLLGTLAAAILTQVRGIERISLPRLTLVFCLCLASVPVTSLLFGLAAGLSVKWIGLGSVAGHLAPPARDAFCHWSVTGGGIGGLLGTALYVSAMVRAAKTSRETPAS